MSKILHEPAHSVGLKILKADMDEQM